MSAVAPWIKIALITGGSRGLGRNTAINLAHKGVDVIFTYHSRADEAASLVSEIEALGRKAVALQLDVGVIAQFDGFADQVRSNLSEIWGRGSFDFLVNNAGVGMGSPFAETTEAMFDQLMNVHFKGVYFLTQKLLPVLADGGRIVNLSSGLTQQCLPGMSAYASMKGAVEVLSRYMAKELGPRGIAVNTVAPGAIANEFGGGRLRDDAAMTARIASLTPLGRIGVSDDVGPMVAALLSDDNRWVNGQRIGVNGGSYI